MIVFIDVCYGVNFADLSLTRFLPIKRYRGERSNSMNLSDLAQVKAINGVLPNAIAIENANKVIELMGIDPASTRSSVEAGVMLRFGTEEIGAFVECYNDEEIGYTLINDAKSVGSKDISPDVSLED